MIYKITAMTANEVINNECACDSMEIAKMVAVRYFRTSPRVVIRNTDTGEIIETMVR